jgi:hypothetical protein
MRKRKRLVTIAVIVFCCLMPPEVAADETNNFTSLYVNPECLPAGTGIESRDEGE